MSSPNPDPLPAQARPSASVTRPHHPNSNVTVVPRSEAAIERTRRICADSRRHSHKVLGCAIRAHWGIENRAHYVRDVTLGEDASRIRTKPGVMTRIRSVALNILRANGVQNISLALYTNAVSFDQLLALGTQ